MSWEIMPWWPPAPEPMTHKAVQRARKGRRLTKHMKQRMADALTLLMKQQGKEIRAPVGGEGFVQLLNSSY
jgi:nitrogen-specific signal transduction histidine kinase